MRRRLQTKRRRKSPTTKPVAAGWHSTGIVMVTAFLWWLVHWFSTVSLSCRDHVEWWSAFRPGMPALVQAASLLSVTLLLWVYVDIVRPKPVRIPVTLRALQLWMATAMVIISVFHVGLMRPHSDEGRIYAYFRGEMTGWPVLNFFFGDEVSLFETEFISFNDEIDFSDPVFDRANALEQRYQDTFIRHAIPRHFGVYEGQLECEAIQELNAAWGAAFEAYVADRQAEEEPEPAFLWE